MLTALCAVPLLLCVCALAPQTTAVAELRLVFSGNDLGFIRPCGCSKPVLGGIARRGTMLTRLRAEGPVMALSCGNLVAESGRQQCLKFEAMLLAMASMKYAAFSPGAGEFALGLAYLREAQALTELPFVCLNVSADNAPVFAPALRPADSGMVVTGLVPAGTNADGCVVQDPVEALRALAESLSSTETLVVMWNGPEEDLPALESALSAERRATTVFALACVGDAPRPISGANSMAAAVGSKGRDLMVVMPGRTPWWRSIRLEESIGPDPECDAILQGYREAVRTEDLLGQSARTAGPAYSGSISCQWCHDDCTVALKDSGHMHALTTLERSGDAADPECVRCHVVGFDDREGWTRERPQLAHVDCEACHGPADAHAQGQGPPPAPKPSPESCLRCHDMDNSPYFDFQTYWPKIRHGK